MLDHERLYEYRFRDVDESGKRAVWGEIAPFIESRLGNPQRLLDPAAGSCEFITAAAAPERWAVDRTRHRGAGTDGIEFIEADVMEAELPARHFDGVLVSNFLEHLTDPDAIAAFLSRLRGWMTDGGRIAILGPNIRHCADSYWDCADHWVPLTEVSVGEHLHAAGFEVTRVTGRFLPYSFRGRLPASAGLTRAYLKLPPLWRIFGRQFLVEARR